MHEREPINPKTILIHHAASSEDPGIPPGSLRALKACLEKDAALIEIDVLPLLDGDFALLHDVSLAAATNGEGNVLKKTSEEIKKLQYAGSQENVATLSQAVELLQEYPNGAILQLDLKPEVPPDARSKEDIFQKLLKIIAPVKEKIIISSMADWLLRLLHQLDPQLHLGFDPLLYLDLRQKEDIPGQTPPYSPGAYHLWDDHPLSSRVWGTQNEYLEARAETLAAQFQISGTWFIRAALLEYVLDNGFNWINFLHNRGNRVAVWTVDLTGPAQENLITKLIEAGVDYITTNTPYTIREKFSNLVYCYKEGNLDERPFY